MRFKLFYFLLFSFFSTQGQKYQNADIPDVLTFLNGEKVNSIADFGKRKKEILGLWCDYFIGHYPKEIPTLLSAEITKTTTHKDGSIRKRVLLTFDTPNKKS